MIKLYQRLTKDCQSINMLNRVHIQLQQHLIPSQFEELRIGLRKKKYELSNKNNETALNIDQLAVEWLDHIDYYYSQTGKEDPEPFIKKRIDRHTLRFTSGDRDSQTADKTLLVCFTGKHHGMMMPLPVFLQYLDAKTTEVIYVKDTSRNSYRNGLAGCDKDFEGMLDRFSFLSFKDYRKVVGMGVSGGTLPILILSLKYEFNAVLVVGAKGPNDPRWIEAIGKRPRRLAINIMKKTLTQPQTFFVHGSDAHRDVRGANLWKNILLDTEIKSIDNVGHAALTPLIENGQFGELLSETIFSKD